MVLAVRDIVLDILVNGLCVEYHLKNRNFHTLNQILQVVPRVAPAGPLAASPSY